MPKTTASMIHFFQTKDRKIIAAEADAAPSPDTREKLKWLFGHADLLPGREMKGYFVGPRKEMITPWSTNAVEITVNMGITGIRRIEAFFPVRGKDASFDPMLQVLYDGLDQQLFSIDREPEPVLEEQPVGQSGIGTEKGENKTPPEGIRRN